MADETAWAIVIEDSVAPSGVRLITELVHYANIVKQDLWTHRFIAKNTDLTGEIESYNLDVSRSSNSNRAISTRKIISDVIHHPFVPERFPKRAVSMHSSKGYHTGFTAWLMRHAWLKTRYIMIVAALLLQWLGCHKQIANRLLDQWQWTTAVFTATDEWWQHFFSLRDHYAAQDQVQDVARAAHNAYRASVPKILKHGEWHLPFVYKQERMSCSTEKQIQLSVARCARISYFSPSESMANLDALTRSVKDDVALHNRLVVQTPEHAGPREHQAQALSNGMYRSGNLRGWDQLRHSATGAMMRARELDKLHAAIDIAPEPTLAMQVEAIKRQAQQ